MARTTVYNDEITREWDGYDDEAGNHIEVLAENKDLHDRFIRYCKANDRSPQTIFQYGHWIRVFMCWNCRENGNKPFVDCDINDFMDYIAYLRDRDMSPRRINSLKAGISSLSNYIQRTMRAQYPTFRNQVRDMEPIKSVAVREKTVLSTEQVDAILNKLVELGEYQLACYLSLICASGARKGEIIQMKASFFGDKAKTVFDGYMYKTPKVRAKGSGKLGKPLEKFVIKPMFDPYLRLWLEERERLGVDCDHLFVRRSGGKWVPATISTANSFARKLSVYSDEDFYSHSGRHYFCTMLKSMDLPDDVIMEIFGWSSNMIPVYDDTPAEERLKKFFKGFGERMRKEGEDGGEGNE